MRVPVRYSPFSTADGEVIRVIVDADGKEVARGNDSADLQAIVAHVNAGLESDALDRVRADYEESLRYLASRMDAMRSQFHRELQEALTALNDAREENKNMATVDNTPKRSLREIRDRYVAGGGQLFPADDLIGSIKGNWARGVEAKARAALPDHDQEGKDAT